MDSPRISLNATYVVQVPLGDDDDYSKRMNVGALKATPYLLWYKQLTAPGAATALLNLTFDDTVGAYIQVDRATTIGVEVFTINGWEPLYMNGTIVTIVFTEADYEFLNIWLLPFQQIRFTTSAAAIITIQCVVRE